MKVYDGDHAPVKAWVDGVPIDDNTIQQLKTTAAMPFIHKWVAAMPDTHLGLGATVGSVIATKGAIIPAAVGVDIGCGMAACKLSLKAKDLPDSMDAIRHSIERTIPHGGLGIKGGWRRGVPREIVQLWDRRLAEEYTRLCELYPKIGRGCSAEHLGTLGGGNHFIEICLDKQDEVWIMLHSGSRGVGNRIGRLFIELAREDMRRHFINLPDKDLAYLPEGTKHFADYVRAVSWAQDYAKANRDAMMDLVYNCLKYYYPSLVVDTEIHDCHHNYIAQENHYGSNVWVTRKGAIRARSGDIGIIPGSMGARSFIVKGLGNPEAFDSCSHGAGRVMSRTEAKKKFTVEDHIQATGNVSCRKDIGVLDETPGAYKDIDAVMAAQADLCTPLVELKQILCVKG